MTHIVDLTRCKPRVCHRILLYTNTTTPSTMCVTSYSYIRIRCTIVDLARCKPRSYRDAPAAEFWLLAQYVCILACMHAYLHSFIHSFIHTYIHAYIYTRIYVYTYIHIHTYIYIHIYICLYIYIYIHNSVCDTAGV